MKYFLIICLFATLTSCEIIPSQQPNESVEFVDYEIEVIKVKGHDYIVFIGYQKGGICHAESCSCKSKGQEQ